MICAKCKKNFCEWVETSKENFCKSCWEKIRPRCIVCREPLHGTYFVTHWGNVCNECHDPKLQCFSCDIQLAENQILRLPDFRPICSGCYSQAVFDAENGFIAAVGTALEKFLIVIKKPVHYRVVDLLKLQHMIAERGNSSITELGVCSTNFLGDRVSHHNIFFLFGMPSPQFMGVLAHELFHAWINENCRHERLSREETEGACDLIAFKIHQVLGHDDFWVKKAESSERHPVYGYGLRKWKNMPISFVLSYLKSK